MNNNQSNKNTGLILAGLDAAIVLRYLVGLDDALVAWFAGWWRFFNPVK